MADGRYLPTDELKLPSPSSPGGCMGGDAESDRSAIDSNPTSPRLQEVGGVRQGRVGKGPDSQSFFGEEETDFGPVGRLFKSRPPVVHQVELVDPMSGERSGGGEESAAQIQKLEGQVRKLEGELQHYQLRVAGVTALVNMLNEKKEEATQWREKSEKLETALSRMEHRAGKLERDLRERNAGGEDSGRRMAPVLPPNKQILNKLARENAQLKLALNRLMGKGIYSYQEGLNISDLERVIEEQAQSIRLLQNQLQKLREGCGIQTQTSDKLPDSGLGASMSFNSTSAPASLSGTSPEVASLKNDMLSLEEKLLRREQFIVTLAEKLAEYQAKERQTPQHVTSAGVRSTPVTMVMEGRRGPSDVQVPEEETKVLHPQPQESTDSNNEEYEAQIKKLEQELSESKEAVEKLSAQLSATCGDLETANRKVKLAEEEVQVIRERAQIHFGKDVDHYTTEINHLRTMVGRLSRQAQELQRQLTQRDDELLQFQSDSAVKAKDNTITRLKEENTRLHRDMEEADFKLKSLKSDRDSVDELRERMDELGIEVRKLRNEKRVLLSQYNEVRANCETATSQNMQFREVLRQAGMFYQQRLPTPMGGLLRTPAEAYRGSPIAVADNSRPVSGFTGGFRDSAVQNPHPAQIIQARGPNANPQTSTSAPQTSRPSLVPQGQPQMPGQDLRYAIPSREVSGSGRDGHDREGLFLHLGMSSQYTQSRTSYTAESVLSTPTTMSNRSVPHFVPEQSGSVRQTAGSPNTTRFVAERDHSGSGNPSYSAFSRNPPHHRQ